MSVLSDQQLAGVIMWVPAGGIYLVAALILLTRWIGEPEPAGRQPAIRPPAPAAPSRSVT